MTSRLEGRYLCADLPEVPSREIGRQLSSTCHRPVEVACWFDTRAPTPTVGHDVKPRDFRAFHCDGKFGIHINAVVWHAAVLPLADRAVFNNRQGRVHASIACDSVEEFNLYFSVLLPPMS